VTRAGHRLKPSRIDRFWKGVLLVEHENAGADLDRAFAQASDGFEALHDGDPSRHILVTDVCFRRRAPRRRVAPGDLRLGGSACAVGFLSIRVSIHLFCRLSS